MHYMLDVLNNIYTIDVEYVKADRQINRLPDIHTKRLTDLQNNISADY